MTTVDEQVRAQEQQAWRDYDRERLQSEPEDLWPPRTATKQHLAADGLGEAA